MQAPRSLEELQVQLAIEEGLTASVVDAWQTELAENPTWGTDAASAIMAWKYDRGICALCSMPVEHPSAQTCAAHTGQLLLGED